MSREAATDLLRDALDEATLIVHYAQKHESVRLGRLISTCTDAPCPEYRAVLAATPSTPGLREFADRLSKRWRGTQYGKYAERDLRAALTSTEGAPK